MNIKLGAKIKALRKRDDITQERLADALGVTSQAVSKWESENGYPDIEYITPIANFFNVTTDFLFDHDTAEKRRKIDEYCEKFDEIRRDIRRAQEQIDLMRKALAEFPAEEKLLIRLAFALELKGGRSGIYSQYKKDTDGKTYLVWDYEKNKTYDCWDEAAKIMEELLANSTDDEIRSQCRYRLVCIYARTGEKEKAMEIVDQCDEIYNSKQSLLATEFDGKDKVMNSQKFVMTLLHYLRIHLWSLANDYIRDNDEIDKTVEIITSLYEHVYKNCDIGFYHFDIKELYFSYSMTHLLHDRFDEALEALEKTYVHSKSLDVYYNELEASGEVKYASPYMDMVRETNDNEAKAGPEISFLLRRIAREGSFVNEKLHDDPRYVELVNRIKDDIAKHTK